jgi:exopolyphosphatase/guanosine-5'-triphosphate,3'-diphosphate pyrophosphatase
MAFVRRAVIDVGTNSVKLLVADVSDGIVQPVHEESKQSRLGEGLFRTNQLQPGPIERTAEAVARFSEIARELNAVSIRAIATSAARDAVNPEDLISAIARTAGLKVEIISGDQEAKWVFSGVATDKRLASGALLLLDVGGGSTEFILGCGRIKRFCASFPVGTVRLMETIPQSNPPTVGELAATREWLRNFLSIAVRPELEPALRRESASVNEPIRLVGTGGTTSILARMESGLPKFNREKIEATRLTLERVRWHTEHLWNLPRAAREEIIGLPRKHADVILTGVAIYEAIMTQFGFSELIVSTRGLRFALAMDSETF